MKVNLLSVVFFGFASIIVLGVLLSVPGCGKRTSITNINGCDSVYVAGELVALPCECLEECLGLPPGRQSKCFEECVSDTTNTE